MITDKEFAAFGDIDRSVDWDSWHLDERGSSPIARLIAEVRRLREDAEEDHAEFQEHRKCIRAQMDQIEEQRKEIERLRGLFADGWPGSKEAEELAHQRTFDP